MNPKSKRADAEKAAEWYAREIHECVETRKAVKTQWQKVDFFGADVVGKKANGEHVYIQATAGSYSAVTARRRKLEAIPWHRTDTVEIVQLVSAPDPANKRKTIWFFKVHMYQYNAQAWTTELISVRIPPEWFKKWKE